MLWSGCAFSFGVLCCLLFHSPEFAAFFPKIIIIAGMLDGIDFITADFFKAAKICMDKCIGNRRIGPNNTVTVANPTEAAKGILGVVICIYFALCAHFGGLSLVVPIIYVAYRIFMYYKDAVIRFACNINQSEG